MLKKVIILIGAGYLIVLMLVLALGLMAASSMNRLHLIAEDIYLHPFTVNDAALDAQANVLWIQHYISDMAASGDPQEFEQMLLAIDAKDRAVKNKLDVVEARFLGNTEKVKEARQLLDEWQAVRKQTVDQARQGHMKRAKHLLDGSGSRIFRQLQADMSYIVGFTRQRGAAFVAEAEREAQGKINLTWWLLGGLVASISIIGGGVAYRVSQLLRRQQKMDEELKKYSAQLEASNLELESFSYSVSHDLRVPLRAVDGFSRILIEEYQEKFDAEGQRLLKVVRDNTRKMAQLIDDILAFSRTGQMELVRTEVDMGDLVRDVMEDLRPAAAGREIRLEVEPLPPAIADRGMVRRVFTNLLANAIKFTRTKAVAQIKVGANRGTDETIYYVKDNGVGFDMRYVDKLFGMFLRLHGVDEFEGTGIGLAIVKRIITRHGGRVWAEGKVNEGATIFFTLPAKEKSDD